MSGVARWDGVVMVVRPDPTQTSHTPFEDDVVECMSARSAVLGGRRAIKTKLPAKMVSHYFRTQDEDHVFVRAELIGDHLQLQERCTLKEWVETCHQQPVH